MPYLPAAADIFASTSPTSQAVFTEFLPFAYMALGFIVGSLFIWWAINGIPHLVRSVFMGHSFTTTHGYNKSEMDAYRKTWGGDR